MSGTAHPHNQKCRRAACLCRELWKEARSKGLPSFPHSPNTDPCLFPLLPALSSKALCLKVVFERILSWLRLGVLPVLVVEGAAPAAKQPLQAQRWAARCGRRQQWGNMLSCSLMFYTHIGIC